MKLLLALDALLREGSVTGAAASLDMQVSSVSRMLGELREMYEDPIFIRTGRGLRPTPFAETLRLRVRAFAEETEALFRGEGWNGDDAPSPSLADPSLASWSIHSRIMPPPLATTRGEQLEAEPSPTGIARRIATIGSNEEPHRRLAKYIALACPGPGRSRPLEVDEARDALSIILGGDADPVQIGALLMTLQYRGATALELAGFVQAIREAKASVAAWAVKPDLDWPAYVSPRWRSPPWFMHSARLVAVAGHRVLMHGHYGSGTESGKLEDAAERASIPVCLTAGEASAALTAKNIAFVPLAAFAPQVQAMLNLHPLLETRTPLHNVVPLINPANAPSTLVGAPGATSVTIYRDVARMLEMHNITIVGTVRNFAQIAPTRLTTVLQLVDGQERKVVIAARPGLSGTGGKHSGYTQREYWEAVWSGAARDELAEATIIYTAATALLAVSRQSACFDDRLQHATELWAARKR
ncbi:MAG: glycosyl transferase family protein [Alphaproteobacteria bacterium]|nr:glycosyl transferase family protein [Alphaproteobacteria bacterium]MBU1552241.1 glycosyl transferase family protein [Alphaproteobacteria bacterium]MBU2336851.1 glycosyl transferase family protein [Alphaproteobacteria bacterium]MBU2389607.1 glycosyl transferase family protein [Alphaproteobacteria bacterium]